MALHRLGSRWQGTVVLVAALAWPVAHIGNVAPLAVAVNVALLVGLGTLLWEGQGGYGRQAATASRSTKSFIS